jgi:beta-glucosidase
MLKGNYCGTASKYTTVLEGIQRSVSDYTRIYYSEGCHLYKDRVEPLAQQSDRISEAVSIAERSDIVVLCLGLDSTIEGEQGDTGNSYGAGDKENLKLPGEQKDLLEKVLETNKPVIVVLGSGSALTLSGVEEKCAAIIQAWYPGSHGGEALADLIFGKFPKW